jgi:D-serine deaminase-like pyridoxal phosphate-dependent protein
MSWFVIDNIDEIDSPALVLYKERIQKNIERAVEMIKDVSLLRPHVKTNKIAEVCEMMMGAGITKFKCATIAEAEMLAMINAKDVLLAYQPVGPKAKRLLRLVQQYPATQFSCIIDNTIIADELSRLFVDEGRTLDVFIDLNSGMKRSGIKPADALPLFHHILGSPGLTFRGLHGYDGQISDKDIAERQQKSDSSYKELSVLLEQIEKHLNKKITVVAGGSPTFPTHVNRHVECSPGTFVFWDYGYKNQLPDEPFDYAALVITRVISIVDETTVTTDLGHKSVAAENPLPRVYFLNATDATPVRQSEEHLVLQVPDSSKYKPGDVLYGVPVHICPTVALYDTAVVVEKGNAVTNWQVVARNRKITI